MQQLTPQVSLDFCCGEELLQVCVGSNEVQLKFESDLMVCIESSCRVVTVTGMTLKIEDFKLGASAICALLRETVESASVTEDGTVALAFSNGSTLCISNSNKPYESFQISKGDVFLVG